MSTTTMEIPRTEWRDFLNTLSRTHHGWHVSLEILDRSAGVGYEAKDLPLEGALMDVRHGDDDNITVMLGHVGDFSHTLTHPTHVRLEQTDEGRDKTLQIESDETTALLHFQR